MDMVLQIVHVMVVSGAAVMRLCALGGVTFQYR
jgi:hypothetical protein